MLEKNPNVQIPENYRYKLSTAYSNLRHHLENHHKEMYVDLCAKNGWSFKLPGATKVRSN
jgi:hypothetical protein